MIVIGVDVHKHSLTAVAVDEVGRVLAEVSAADECALLAWSTSLPVERLWAVEDCRHVTRALEHALVAAGEPLVRVPPKLTAPQRRSGRVRGKSDRSTRSRSRGRLCVSRAWTGLARVSSGCVS